MTTVELWTAKDVADFLGLASTGSARRTLSRWGIEAVSYQRSKSGRPEAQYDAKRVRVAHSKRPGRGARTDLHGNARGNP